MSGTALDTLVALTQDRRNVETQRPGRYLHNSGQPEPDALDERTTILIVEDEELIRMITAERLREASFRVLEASDAEQAQQYFDMREPIALVFSDIDMPGSMDGIGLAKWLDDGYPDIGVILTSGRPYPADRPRTCRIFLRKPYTFTELSAVIAFVLKHET